MLFLKFWLHSLIDLNLVHPWIKCSFFLAYEYHIPDLELYLHLLYHYQKSDFCTFLAT